MKNLKRNSLLQYYQGDIHLLTCLLPIYQYVILTNFCMSTQMVDSRGCSNVNNQQPGYSERDHFICDSNAEKQSRRQDNNH